MILIPLIVIVAFVVFFIRRENKQALIRQWQLAADTLTRIKCDPGGTLSGNPTLYGYIEGRRIDVATFFHREFGSSTTQMTGYRVERNSAVELPAAAINSLTKHFPKFEVDAKRIFCGSYGIENPPAISLQRSTALPPPCASPMPNTPKANSRNPITNWSKPRPVSKTNHLPRSNPPRPFARSRKIFLPIRFPPTCARKNPPLPLPRRSRTRPTMTIRTRRSKWRPGPNPPTSRPNHCLRS